MDEAERKTHRHFAVSLFNRVWDLLEKKDRSADDDVEMLNAAHGSLYHWLQVGEAKNFSIGEWQLSRVYATLRRPEAALYHGQRALEVSEKANLAPFYIAYAHEALARANVLTNNAPAIAKHLEAARTLAQAVEKAEDRSALLKDLESIKL
jgi:hypothetical protein